MILLQRLLRVFVPNFVWNSTHKACWKPQKRLAAKTLGAVVGVFVHIPGGTEEAVHAIDAFGWHSSLQFRTVQPPFRPHGPLGSAPALFSRCRSNETIEEAGASPGANVPLPWEARQCTKAALNIAGLQASLFQDCALNL